MQNGWALQCGTSHFLGQNFAKAFDVTFQNKDGELEHVWATSWGVSTRLIGAVIMTHSDDQGLVLPPAIAPVQVVIVPIWRGDKKAMVMEYVDQVVALLRGRFRVRVDDRDNLKPGAKYFEWERKGVPLRMEIGPRDVEGGAVMCRTRLGGDKFKLAVGGDLADEVGEVLDGLQRRLLDRAIALRDDNIVEVDSYDAMKARLEEQGGGWFLVPWRDYAEAEAAIKADCKATIRCYPLDGQDAAKGRTCFYSGAPATHMAIFARAY